MTGPLHYADHDGTPLCGANDGCVTLGLVQTTCDACVEVVHRTVEQVRDEHARHEAMLAEQILEPVPKQAPADITKCGDAEQHILWPDGTVTTRPFEGPPDEEADNA